MMQFSEINNVGAVDEQVVLAAVDSIASYETLGVEDLGSLRQTVSFLDITTLEGADTEAKVGELCERALEPAPPSLECGRVAAVCVYPTLVNVAKQELAGSDIKVASVAGGFPSGQTSLEIKLAEIRYAIDEGADEIDTVISRGKFLEGKYEEVYDEIAACKQVCGEAHLKVILETGELGSLTNVRLASDIAIAAGADFIKTSTGKIQPAATLPVTYVMLQAIADHYASSGKMVGIKPAGGISKASLALTYRKMIDEVLGEKWLTNEWFRIGASSLLNDLVSNIEYLNKQ